MITSTIKLVSESPKYFLSNWKNESEIEGHFLRYLSKIPTKYFGLFEDHQHDLQWPILSNFFLTFLRTLCKQLKRKKEMIKWVLDVPFRTLSYYSSNELYQEEQCIQIYSWRHNTNLQYNYSINFWNFIRIYVVRICRDMLY